VVQEYYFPKMAACSLLMDLAKVRPAATLPIYSEFYAGILNKSAHLRPPPHSPLTLSPPSFLLSLCLHCPFGHAAPSHSPLPLLGPTAPAVLMP